MKILIDTNIILDIILERQPFFELATKVLQEAQRAKMALFVTAITIADLYYITRKAKGRVIALDIIADLLQFMEVASVDKEVIMQALHSNVTDFEDAIQENAAKKQAIRVIITRNEADFKNSTLEVHNPESFLNTLR